VIRVILITALVPFCFIVSSAQQVPDTVFTYSIEKPAYYLGTGPVVSIDEGHNNFHTRSGRYAAFSRLLTSDGYRLKSLYDTTITESSLTGIDILVIANPLHHSNISQWILPTPSAYTEAEIVIIRNWVAKGGSLFLIADHMPFAGAAQALGEAFGVQFVNGFALDNRRRDLEEFTCQNGLNCSNGILDLDGDTIITFTGSAFKIQQKHYPLLMLNETYTVLIPEVAWEFNSNTPFIEGGSFEQVAAMEFGEGKLIISAEAAMFSAQLSGVNRSPVGFNLPEAQDNCAFLLNLVHWLSVK
jgi:hypothetical protein